MAQKVYLITRADLSPGQQATQAAHALQEYNVQFPEEARAWYVKSNTLALLTVPTEADLLTLSERASGFCTLACFREPDRENELTAIAIGPEGARWTKSLPLALCPAPQ